MSKFGPKCTSVTRAPLRHRSSAASAAELPPPTTIAFWSNASCPSLYTCDTCSSVSPGTLSRLGEPKYPVAITTKRARTARTSPPRRSVWTTNFPSLPVTCGHLLELPHRNAEVRDHRPIVRERIPATWLVAADRKRQPANGQLLRRGEKAHVRGIRRNRARDGAAIEHHAAQPRAKHRDRGGESARSGTDNRHVDRLFDAQRLHSTPMI